MDAITPLDHADRTTAAGWRDHKRWLWLLGLLVPTLPFLAWQGGIASGWGIFWWTGPIVVFGLIPLLDVAFGLDRESPPDEVLARLEADRYYRWCTYLYLPLQYAGLVLACWLWTRGDLPLLDRLGLAITVGCVSGIGINAAHELGHKKQSAERWLSRIALAQTGYGHFYIEHNRGHHVRVATPEDPASARLGESFWAFLPRTVVGSVASAWRLERKRMKRRGLHLWSIQNDIVSAWLMTLTLVIGLTLAFGPRLLPWFAVQAVFGFCLLEVVNYLEHYGLCRQKAPDGRYERVRAEHSWNSDNITTNVLLFHLQRHSDHHANPTRRYQALRSVDEAPNLPAGYAAMILAAWVPPLWRRVMDQRVLAHYGGDVTRANISPRHRARLLATHGKRSEAA
jgi:alkane 1-monooxygenase